MSQQAMFTAKVVDTKTTAKKRVANFEIDVEIKADDLLTLTELTGCTSEIKLSPQSEDTPMVTFFGRINNVSIGKQKRKLQIEVSRDIKPGDFMTITELAGKIVEMQVGSSQLEMDFDAESAQLDVEDGEVVPMQEEKG